MLKVLRHILLDTCTYLFDIMYWIYYCYFGLDYCCTLNFGCNCRIHFCFCITTVMTVFGRLAMQINWLVSVWFRSWDQNVWYWRYVFSTNSIYWFYVVIAFVYYFLINFFIVVAVSCSSFLFIWCICSGSFIWFILQFITSTLVFMLLVFISRYLWFLLHNYLFLFSLLFHHVSNLSYCHCYLFHLALVLVVLLLILLVYNFLDRGSYKITIVHLSVCLSFRNCLLVMVDNWNI